MFPFRKARRKGSNVKEDVITLPLFILKLLSCLAELGELYAGKRYTVYLKILYVINNFVSQLNRC
jgi:hypothetical protein